jgi:hypothetical protein
MPPPVLRACERKGTGTSPPAIFAGFPQTGSEPVPFLSQALIPHLQPSRVKATDATPCFGNCFKTGGQAGSLSYAPLLTHFLASTRAARRKLVFFSEHKFRKRPPILFYLTGSRTPGAVETASTATTHGCLCQGIANCSHKAHNKRGVFLPGQRKRIGCEPCEGPKPNAERCVWRRWRDVSFFPAVGFPMPCPPSLLALDWSQP